MEKLFDSQQAFALFLIFFVPGFISLKVYDLFIPAERRDFSKSLYDAVAYSALNFVALFWLISELRQGKLYPAIWYLGFFTVVIGAPAAWPLYFFGRAARHGCRATYLTRIQESGMTFLDDARCIG